jgi:hypothetical protein
MAKNYLRLMNEGNEVSCTFFDDSDREQVLLVVNGAIGEAALRGKHAMVRVWNISALPPGLAEKVFAIGAWVCPKCRKDANGCKGHEKEHQTKYEKKPVKASSSTMPPPN